MVAYYIVGVMAVMLGFMSYFIPERKLESLENRRKLINKHDWYFIAVALFLFVLLVLEDTSSNSDLLKSYEPAFYRQEYRTLDYYISRYPSVKDPVYHICTLLFQRLGFSFYTWKALVAFLFVFSTYRLIHHYSKNPSLSYLVIISLGLFNFSLSAMRQTIALSILCFSYEFLKEKKLLRFMLIVGIAALFHRTVFIFLLAYPVYHLRAKKSTIPILAAVGTLIIVFSKQLTEIYIQWFGLEDTYSDYFDSDRGLTIWGVVILALIWVYCTFFLYKKGSKPFDRNICNLLLVSVVFRVISVFWVAEFFRVSMYFSVFDFLCIADACTCEKKRSVDNVKTAAVALALVAYYFYNQQPNIVTFVFR